MTSHKNPVPNIHTDTHTNTNDKDSIAKILVIKLGALGDFIQALGPMRAIRARHPNAHIALLTTAPFVRMGEDCGYFNDVYQDPRPKWHEPLKWLSLRLFLNEGEFDRIYDLQNNDRTCLYFRLLSRSKISGVKPQWSGIAKGASHRNSSPGRSLGKAFDGHCQTLRLAGIRGIELDRLDWMASDTTRFQLPENYGLLLTGSSPKHPEKRWPAENYAALASKMLVSGVTPVLIGTRTEQNINAQITERARGTIDLSGQTSLHDIAALARGAEYVVGNDTGPMHLAAATGVRCITLFCTKKSNPAKHGPMGQRVRMIESNNLADLTPDELWTVIAP